MPEGPECRIIAEGLSTELKGNKVESLELISGRYLRHGPPKMWREFLSNLPTVCDHVGFKGKFIYLTFENSDWSIWNTLGMSGCWLKEQTADARVSLAYQDALGKDKKLYFTDQRNFGTLKFANNTAELVAKLTSLGLDLLNTDVSHDMSIDIFRKKRNQKKTLAEVLMNQKNFAGVGNYIKAEALYRAKLSPHRTSDSLSDDDITLLHDQLKEVMRGSYAARGFSMKNYKDLNGEVGKFQKIVYRQNKDPYGNPVIKEETKDRRTTHWVPKIQK